MALAEHIATDEICINEMNTLHISRANSAREHQCTPGTIKNRLCQYLHSKLALWYPIPSVITGYQNFLTYS